MPHDLHAPKLPKLSDSKLDKKKISIYDVEIDIRQKLF